MIREFALEPEIITSWDSFCRFTGDFGVPLGRLIASYPTYWAVLLQQHIKQLDMGDSQRKLIEVKMGSPAFRRKLAPREGAKFNKANTWVENAQIEHTRKPFDAIVAAANPDNRPEILVADDLDPDDPRWKVRHSQRLPRRPQDIADAARPLLQMSREVLLVDRYFRPEGKALKPLQAILDAIGRRPLSRLEYHVGDSFLGRWTIDQFKAAITGCISRDLPADLQLQMIIWPHGRFHDRFILTEVGGLEFSAGLDTSWNQEQTVTLVDQDVYSRVWPLFQIGPRQQPSHTFVINALGRSDGHAPATPAAHPGPAPAKCHTRANMPGRP